MVFSDGVWYDPDAKLFKMWYLPEPAGDIGHEAERRGLMGGVDIGYRVLAAADTVDPVRQVDQLSVRIPVEVGSSRP